MNLIAGYLSSSPEKRLIKRSSGIGLGVMEDLQAFQGCEEALVTEVLMPEVL